MIKRIILFIGVLLFIGSLTLLVISYSRGYRFNFAQKTLTPTGILSASSYPQNASILIDNKLVSATNASITLSPGWYQVKITKEGYQNWEKRIRVQGEVVSTIDVLLLPTNPSLRTLTTSGVQNPLLSPSGTKVAYIFLSQDATGSALLKQKNGIYTLDLRSGPLGGRIDQKPVFTPSTTFDWKNASLIWSSDEKQLLITFSKTDGSKIRLTSAYLVDSDNPNSPGIDVTAAYETFVQLWKNQETEKVNLAIDALPQSLATFLRRSVNEIHFAPDDSKIYYLATASATLVPIITPPIIGSNPTEEVRSVVPGKYYVFDIKEDKNFSIADKKNEKQGVDLVGWYTDSKHLILVENNTISFVDYDGTNKRSVYSGPFIDSIVYPFATGGKIVILTNFNNPLSAPNFYEIDLR